MNDLILVELKTFYLISSKLIHTIFAVNRVNEFSQFYFSYCKVSRQISSDNLLKQFLKKSKSSLQASLWVLSLWFTLKKECDYVENSYSLSICCHRLDLLRWAGLTIYGNTTPRAFGGKPSHSLHGGSLSAQAPREPLCTLPAPGCSAEKAVLLWHCHVSGSWLSGGSLQHHSSWLPGWKWDQSTVGLHRCRLLP